MPWPTLVWLALLVVLALLFVATLRRASALAARTRSLERFQGAADSLDRRFAAIVGPLVAGLDEIRHHVGDPAALRDQLTATQAGLDELQNEAEGLAAPTGLVGMVTLMRGDLDRAQRAASLVEHGLASMVNTTIGRDLEAQTSLKRGSLNLRHAQGAFALRAREVAALRPADLLPGAPRRASEAGGGIDSTAESDELNRSFDPRM
jgi:hypothetical protein